MMNPVFRNTQTELLTWQECSKLLLKCFEDCTVIFERYKGSYGDLSVHWGDFLDKYKGVYYGTDKNSGTFYDDPGNYTPWQNVFAISVSMLRAGCTLENICTIKGGRFCGLSFQRPREHIYTTKNLFSVWLPQSKYRLTTAMALKSIKRTAVPCMDIDICIPVK